LERRAASSPFAIGIGFNEAEWEGNSAQFRGELIEINNNIATMQQMVTYSDEGRKRVLVRTEGDGVGIFYIQGKHFRIAPGLPMLWRTVAPDLKHESDAPH
jgi:hypothetical protein